MTREAGVGGTGVGANVLVAGDRLRLNSGAVVDTSENVNAPAAGRAIAEQASPRVQSVGLSNPLHSVQTRWAVPDEFFSGDDAGDDTITIAAKGDGDAAGAAGNDWSIVFDTPSTYSAARAADIDVRVDTKGKSVTVRFNNGPVTVGSLLAALEASGDFDARFSASTGCDATAANALEPSTAPADRDNTASFVDAAGTDADAGIVRTQFAIEVRSGSCIASHVDTPLLEGVLARTIARNCSNEAADTQAELLGLLGDGAGTGVLVGGAAGRTVRYEMATAPVALMPMDRDRVVVAAGAEALADDPNTDESESDFRPPAAHVAVGYASDVNTTTARAKIDQNNNGGSDLRISQTGTIKARNQRDAQSA